MRRVANGLLVITILLLNIPAVFGQGNGKIRVQQITPVLTDSALTVSAVFENLFSEKIVGTIQSGLPSIIQVEIKLLEDGDRQVMNKQFASTISYDIWNELYKIENPDTAETFADFEKVKSRISRMQNEFLTSLKRLRSQARYRVQIRVGIVPISSRQTDKVSDWILDPNQTEERIASEDRSAGFKFTLSNLVSFFVDGNKRSHYISEWFSGEAFRLDELR